MSSDTGLMRVQRKAIFSGDFLPGEIFSLAFSEYAFFEFDEFLYRMQERTIRSFLGCLDAGFIVEVLGQDAQIIKEDYGIDPIADCSFFGDSYKNFISKDLANGAHSIELIADNFAWFSKQNCWAALGSRDLGLTFCGRNSFSNDARNSKILAKETVLELLAKEMGVERAMSFLKVVQENHPSLVFG